MHRFRVALLQAASPASDPQETLAQGEALCRQAQALGADVALFPEMWNVGYTFPDPGDAAAVKRWQGQAIGPDDEYVRHFRGLAASLGLAIALTYLERWPGAPRNTVVLIDRHGAIPLTYAKVHTCDFDREAQLTPGDGFRVATLETAGGPVDVGAMICYDREFPESARVLMLKGAEVILVPNACPLDRHRLAQFHARAFENMTALAMANYAGPGYEGRSVAVDGIAYADVDGGPRDMTVLEAETAEGVYVASFDLDRLRAYRERETWGNAYRKPAAYGPLLEAPVNAPFIRRDARRSSPP